MICITNQFDSLHTIGTANAYISRSAIPYQSYAQRSIHQRQHKSSHYHTTELFSSRVASSSTALDDSRSISKFANTNNEHQSYNNHQSTSLYNVGYDAEAIMQYYDLRPWEVGLRLNMLGLPLLGWYLGLVMDNILKINGKEEVERKRGEELREHFVRSKSVALIKSGQALSLRPDLLKSKIWSEELGKLVDEVGSFPDVDALNIIRDELSDLLPSIKKARKVEQQSNNRKSSKQKRGRRNKLTRLVESDPILSLFEFDNDVRTVASASIGQVVSCVYDMCKIHLYTICLWWHTNELMQFSVQSKNTARSGS